MSQKESNQYLQFFVMDQCLMVPIELVDTVLLLPKLQRVPSPHPAFRGMLNYHGAAVPVYDLPYIIQSCCTVETPDTPILLLNMSSRAIALIVTEVSQLLNIVSRDLKSPTGNVEAYVDLLLESEKINAWVLNVDKLIDVNHLKTLVGEEE